MSKPALPPQPKHENSEYAAFARRVVRRFAERVGEGDIDALPALLALRDDVDKAIAGAVGSLRGAPSYYSWAEIARRIGVSRQAAMQRWPQPDKSRGRQPGGQPGDRR